MPVDGFRAGSAKVEHAVLARADMVVEVLKHEPTWRIVVEGHADSSEGRRALELSERRAIAVRDYLVSRGINRARMVVKGLADQKPVAPSKTESDRARNRRVSFRRTDVDGGAD